MKKNHYVALFIAIAAGLMLAIPWFPVQLFALVVLAGMAFRYPKEGVYFLVLYYPFRTFLVFLCPSIKWLGVMVVASLVIAGVQERRKRKISVVPFTGVEIGFFLFILVGVVAALLSGVSLAAILFESRIFLAGYAIYYVTVSLRFEKRDMKIIAVIIVLTGVVLASLGLVEKFSQKSFLFPEAWAYLHTHPVNGDRVYGLMKNPNVLATYLVLCIMSAYSLFRLLKGWAKWTVLGGAGLMGIVFLMTYSRGTFLAYFGFSQGKKRRIMIVTSLLCTVGIGLWVTLGHEKGQTSRIKETFSEETLELSLIDGRMSMIVKGVEIFRQHPFIGTGFGTFGDAATKTYSSPIYAEYGIAGAPYSDNQYIQVLAQTGIIGILGFCGFQVAMIRTAYKKRQEKEPLALPFMLLLAGIGVLAVFYNIWEDKTTLFILFLLFGLLQSKGEKM